MTIPLFDDIRRQRRAFLRQGAGALAVLLVYAAVSWGLSAFFNRGLQAYYCLEPTDILCIGHSMTAMGLDKVQLEKCVRRSVGKYSMSGVGPVERLVMLKHYLECVKTPPKILVYDVSARSFSSGLAEGSYLLFLPWLGSSESCRDFIRKNMAPWEFCLFRMMPLLRYEDNNLGAVQRGFARDWRTRKTTHFDPVVFRRKLDAGDFWHITETAEAVEAFEATLKLCREKKIRVLLTALPCVDMLNRAEPEKYERVMRFFRDHCDPENHVMMFDLNPEFSRRYELFADPIHLNPRGQQVVSEALGRELDRLLSLK